MRFASWTIALVFGCAVLSVDAFATAPAGQADAAKTAAVPLRLVVTDAKGRIVTDLTAADIQISEGGTPRPVASVEFRNVKGPRKIAILLDDYHVAAGIDSARVRAALLEFLNRAWRPDDVVFMMKPLDQTRALTPVRSIDDLRAAVANFEGRKGDYTPRTPFEAELMSVAPPTAPIQRAQVSRAAMQALVTQLAAFDDGDAGTKAVIVVTEGFPAETRGGRERLATLRTIARSARLANVAVYVVDPSGAEAPPVFDEAWHSLVAQTGGVLTTAAAPLEPALARVAADLDEHYIVTLPPVAEDGLFHPLDVKVKRRDVTVRAPSGFWTPIAAERASPPARPAMSTYLRTPHLTGLIQPWFRMTRAGGGQTQVTFSWVPRGPRATDASVEFSAVTFEGVQLQPVRVVPKGTGEGARATFDAPPGAIQVTMAIKDAAGKIVDTEVRYIEVPSLDARAAMISAVELLRTRTVREFARVQLDADAMPADSRDFDHQDHVIVRVRAFGATGTTASVTARLMNPRGQLITDLSPLPDVGGNAQFDLPLARYPSGDYRLEIRASDAKSSTAQLITFRLIG